MSGPAVALLDELVPLIYRARWLRLFVSGQVTSREEGRAGSRTRRTGVPGSRSQCRAATGSTCSPIPGRGRGASPRTGSGCGGFTRTGSRSARPGRCRTASARSSIPRGCWPAINSLPKAAAVGAPPGLRIVAVPEWRLPRVLRQGLQPGLWAAGDQIEVIVDAELGITLRHARRPEPGSSTAGRWPRPARHPQKSPGTPLWPRRSWQLRSRDAGSAHADAAQLGSPPAAISAACRAAHACAMARRDYVSRKSDSRSTHAEARVTAEMDDCLGHRAGRLYRSRRSFGAASASRGGTV